MVGVRQFNTEIALDSAMGIFWELGYEAASIDELAKATKLSRSSLYGAFGNKEDLFLRVIDRYLEGSRSKFEQALAHSDLKQAVRGALEVLRDRLADSNSKAGCLLVLATEASETRSPTICRRVAKAFAEEEQAFYNRFLQALRQGELVVDADPRALSRFFASQGRAMGVNARISNDPSIHDDVINTAMQCLTTVCAAS